MGNNPAFQYGVLRDDVPPKPGHSKELICWLNKDKPDELAPGTFQGMNTIWEIYQKTVKRIPNHKHLGSRNPLKEGHPYEWKSFGEVFEIMTNFAIGLEQSGFCPVQNVDGINYAFLGIYSKNREEWAMADLACLRSDVTIVPIFESLGSDALAFVLNQTQLTTICIESKAIDLMIKLKTTKCSILQNLICFDEVSAEQREKTKNAGLQLLNFYDVVEIGQKAGIVQLREPTAKSIYMFCYTSGTTGDPKGVMISHESFVSCIHLTPWFDIDLNEDDVHISYLPYGHTFEQNMFVFSLYAGLASGFYSGDPLKLLDDIKVLKPTIFMTVPRILNRVYGKIQESIQSKGKFTQWLFNKAVNSKLYNYEHGGSLSHKIYDKLVFSKVKEQFGGNVRCMISASAPISHEVLTFFKIALGIHIYEVYGQTETNGPATFTSPRDNTIGHVGGVLPSMKIRLRDLPELGYLTSDDPPRGEVQFYGNNVFKGYFKNPEKTKEAFSEDGWVNSGDVGVILPNGAIKIIDRAKNIFKLSQGEYIAPEKLENIYSQCPLVQQIFVYGDSLQNMIVAIIVPDMHQAKEFGKSKGLSEDDTDTILEDNGFKKQILEQMDAKAKEYNLTSLEKIKKIHLTAQPFTVDNDLITPTFKIKRNIAKKTFQAQIDKLYAEPL